MGNIFKEAKKYQKAHPKTDWQAAIKKVSKGAKVGAKKPAKRKTTVTVKVGAKKKSSSKTNTNMARKTKKRTTHHRVGAAPKKHHRVGAAKSAKMNHAVMMLLGGVAGGVAATALQRVMPNANPKMVGGIQTALGVAGAVWLKQPLLQGVAFGMGTAGAVQLAHQYGVLKGVEDMMGGITNYQTLSGLPNEMIMVEEPEWQMHHSDNMPSQQNSGDTGIGGIF